VASFLISLSAISAIYLVLFFPVVRNGFFDSSKLWWEEHRFFFNSITKPVGDNLISSVGDSLSLNVHLDFGSFMDTSFFCSNFEFGVDSVSGIMVLTITIISFLVHVYSISYMKNDPHVVRFFGLLALFTFFMIMLVISTDLVMLYIGWEGVGLSSYLLISF